ncbi:MAG: hypothetical protein WCR04_11585 [Fibrobacteraceae bacterium]
MKKIVLTLATFTFSICFADIHPGLKSAIDAGNIKQAKNLVEKMGISDIYCPASLKLSDARKIYERAFDNFPLLFWDGTYSNISVDSVFLDNYVVQSCAGKSEVVPFFEQKNSRS